MVMKTNSVISIYGCQSTKEIRSFEVRNVAAAILSPRGTFLQTFQKSSTPQEKNLTLWKTETGESVYQHSQKNMSKTTWYAFTILIITKPALLLLAFYIFKCKFFFPNAYIDTFVIAYALAVIISVVRPSIQFSSDEAVACRMATNEIQFFDTGDFSKGVINRLRVQGVAAIALSGTPGSHIAAFVPESKVGSL